MPNRQSLAYFAKAFGMCLFFVYPLSMFKIWMLAVLSAMNVYMKYFIESQKSPQLLMPFDQIWHKVTADISRYIANGSTRKIANK